MLTTLLIVAVYAAMALMLVASWVLYRAQEVQFDIIRDHELQLGAVRERAGVTDNDVDDYHDRIHPECAETGGR